MKLKEKTRISIDRLFNHMYNQEDSDVTFANLDYTITGIFGGYVRIMTKFFNNPNVIAFFENKDPNTIAYYQCFPFKYLEGIVYSKEITDNLREFCEINSAVLKEYWEDGFWFSITDFDRKFKAIRYKRIFTEMALIGKEESGINSDLYIYVSKKQGEHWARIKVYRNKSDKGNFVSLWLDKNNNLEILKKNFELTGYEKKEVERFIRLNKKELEDIWTNTSNISTNDIKRKIKNVKTKSPILGIE